MTAIPTRGLKMYIGRPQGGPAPSPIAIDVSAVAAANPAVLTADAADVAKMFTGVEITITNSTLAKLNGVWKATKLSTTTFSIPVDTSGDDTAAVTLTATIPGQPDNVVPFISITNAEVPLVTLASADMGAFEIKDGDIVSFANTGVGDLDNGAYAVKDANAAAGTFTLWGADLSDAPAVVTSGTMYLWQISTLDDGSAALLEACGNAFDYSQSQGSTVDVSTTCGSASLAGEPGSGTVTFGGYMEPDSLGYKELQKAAVDGIPRIFVLKFPSERGYIILPAVTWSGFSWSIALNGAVAVSATGVVNSPPVYAY